MKKSLFLAGVIFCCSTTFTFAQDNSALYIDNDGATPDNKPLVNSKLVHIDQDGDMLFIDGLQSPNCKIRKTTPEMEENLKNLLTLSTDTFSGKDYY